MNNRLNKIKELTGNGVDCTMLETGDLAWLVETVYVAVEALEFYATYSPRQHPEGYYEIHVKPGEGGEVRFGTKANEALAKIKQPMNKGVL